MSTTRHYFFPKHFVFFFLYCFCMLSDFAKVFERKVWRVQVAHLHNARALSSPSRCLTNLGKNFFRCLCDKKNKKTNRMWFSVGLVKFHWFGINGHVFNQSECRNCCLCVIFQKIAPQAKSGKYFQMLGFSRIWGGGGGNGGPLSMRMQVILDSSFARPGSASIWGEKKGELRDWTTAAREMSPRLSPEGFICYS